MSKQLVTRTKGLNPGDTEYLRICSKGGPSNQLHLQHYPYNYASRGKKKVKPNGIKKKQWKQCQALFLGAPKSLQMVIAAMKLKDAHSLEEKL